MSHKDNQDLRIREGGGWFWAEHELFTVFAPLIGPHGVSVYIAMARLIPLIAVDPYRYRMSVRFVMLWGCCGRDKTAEMMRLIMKLGMVVENKYLDGRESTYKLMSLRDLAKVGEAELKRRIGVRPADTAPFDQSVKNKREKELREAKRKETSAEEAAERDLPMFDGQDAQPEGGVRTADTLEDDDNAGDGVRIADTVSATEANVSAKTADVSAKNGLVSASEGSPLIQEEKREESRTPLPPAKRGEVGPVDSEPADPDQARPVLPVPECLYGDPRFAECVPIATAWVLSEVGVTKRRMAPIVDAQLALYCRNNRSTPLEDAAVLMAKQSRLLHEHAHLLRHNPWNFENFIGKAHWTRPLPYATEPTRRDAAVGSSQPYDAPAANAAFNARLRAYLLAQSQEYAEALPLREIAVELRELAKVEDLRTEAVATKFNELNARGAEALLQFCSDADLARLKAAVDEEFADARKRYPGLPAAQYDSYRQRIRDRKLWAMTAQRPLELNGW